MASTATIPTKQYVTIQYRADASTESGLLGFMSPYTKDAAFLKRKNTQDSWAYSHQVKVNIDPEDDSISCEGLSTRSWNGTENPMFDVSALFVTKCYPIIIDNEPLDGFEIAKSVRRYGWGGGGNVVWRIADPRGFELEISSDNFARIIDCATIVNGRIQGKCVWGREGSKNILLPESSDICLEAKARTEAVNSNIGLADVQIGDMVELLSKDGKPMGGEYLGSYHILMITEGQLGKEYNHSSNGVYSLKSKQIQRYLIRQADGTFLTPSTPKVTKIVTRIGTPKTKEEVAKEINASLSPSNMLVIENTYDRALMISPTKLKPSSIKMTLEPIEHDGDWITTGKYGGEPEAVVCKIGEQYYMSAFKAHEGDHQKYNPIAIECEVDLDRCGVTLTMDIHSSHTNYYYGRSYSRTTRQLLDQNIIQSAEKFRIRLTSGELTALVYSIDYLSYS